MTSVKTDRGSHPGTVFPWTKAAGAWRWPPISSAEVKNVWRGTCSPPLFMHGKLLGDLQPVPLVSFDRVEGFVFNPTGGGMISA
jgi:hypothetical protein